MFALILCLFFFQFYTSEGCVCFTTSGVRVRSSPCGGIVGSASSPSCFESLGESRQCNLGGTVYTFRKFNFRGRVGWSAGNFMRDGSSSECATQGGNCDNVELVSRAGWGARSPTSTSAMSTPVSMVFIHHTAGSFCSTSSQCQSQMRGIQNFHMDSRGWSDIGYSFLVGEDGRAYEGRGWSRVGAHTRGYNSQAIAISLIGDYTSRNPNQAALSAVRNLLDCGVKKGFIRSNYELFGHRDGGCTACPGNTLYPTIQSWPEYSSRDIPRYCRKEDEPMS